MKIDILGVSEIHWNVDKPELFPENGYVVITSSRPDHIHRQGVAFILTKKIANSLLNYNKVSEKVLSIEIETKNGSLTLIQVYAPDCSYDDCTINIFYDEIQNEIDKV